MLLDFPIQFRRSMMFGMALLSLAVVMGCSSPTPVGPKEDAVITGKVTYKGTAVTNARVSFESDTLGAFGTEFQGGTYSIPKGSSGDFLVSVTPILASPKMEAGKMPKPEKRSDIPAKYQKAATSGLKASFKPGENTFDIEMVD